MTKSRKRMLLSSVAMLLVALVALGSATYAWFSVSKTVSADHMQVKAVATAGLEISNTGASGTYDPVSVSFGQTESGTGDAAPFSLQPVSWNGVTTDAFIPDGNVGTPGGSYSGDYKATSAGQTPAVTPAASGTAFGHNNYFAVYKVWVRSAAEGSTRTAHTVDAKVTIGGTNQTFARCKLVDETASASYLYADQAEATAAVVTAAPSTKGTYALAADGAAQTVSPTTNTATATEYTLYVWFDGEDAQCVDTAKGSCADITIEFTATDM